MLVGSCMTLSKSLSIFNLDFFICKTYRMRISTSQGYCQSSEGTRQGQVSINRTHTVPTGNQIAELPVDGLHLPYVEHLCKQVGMITCLVDPIIPLCSLHTGQV